MKSEPIGRIPNTHLLVDAIVVQYITMETVCVWPTVNRQASIIFMSHKCVHKRERGRGRWNILIPRINKIKMMIIFFTTRGPIIIITCGCTLYHEK